MMPQVVSIKVHKGRNRQLRLWIPVAPVILVLMPLLLLVLAALVIACLINGIKPTRALAASWRLLSSLRGTRIEIQHGRTAVLVSV